MNIATPQQKTSWASLISDIGKLGEENGKPFPAEKLKQMRSLISAVVKPRFPLRTYKAKHQTKKGKLVTWIWLDQDLGQKNIKN